MGISGIIFLKKIPWNWSMDLYTWVHGTPVHRSTKVIKRWLFKMRFAPSIDPNESVPHLLIAAVRWEMGGSWHSGRRRWRAWLRAAVRHGPHRSSSARGSSAWKATRLRAKWRAVHGDLPRVKMKTGGYGWGLRRRCTPPPPDPRRWWLLAPVHLKPEGWLSRIPYSLLLLPRAPIALVVVKSSRNTSFVQALGLSSCGSKFGWYGRLYIGIPSLSWRGFNHEAVLILHPGSDTLQLRLIRRGRTRCAVQVRTRPWRRGDDGGRLGQRGVLGCMKRLGHAELLLRLRAGERKEARLGRGEFRPMAIF
jgi:hypothetical protein